MSRKILEVVIISFVMLAIIIVVPYVYVYILTTELPDYSNTGQIGDTVQGLAGPFISAFSAVLVYVAFKQQVEANKLLNDANTAIRLKDAVHDIKEQLKQVE